MMPIAGILALLSITTLTIPIAIALTVYWYKYGLPSFPACPSGLVRICFLETCHGCKKADQRQARFRRREKWRQRTRRLLER